MVLLKVEKLKKWFPMKKGIFGKTFYVRAVENVSFELEKGEAVSLVGESGSGKTTLGKTILRLYEPTDGRIFFDGKDITSLSNKELMWYRRQTGIVQQDPYGSLAPHFTIYKILEEPLIIHGVSKEERREKIFSILNEIRLPPEEFAFKYPHMLSGGQLQRVAIARAMILDPKLIVADEPVSMLDASVRVEILNLFAELQRKHDMSVIYITHDLSTTRYFSEKIFIMYAGHIVERAPTKEMLNNPLHPYTRALFNAIPDPDPENRLRMREVPPGEPPSLVNPPPGCRFKPRCPIATSKCDEEPPEYEVSPGHFVKCWYPK
ncbi:ABC transporter ATP-binding protein [Candidatus Korarchaeum cryptofilum]|jgi:peptide/nickel transport system ATP-binding protein|uniref:ABC-type oligopeptide transport system, ATPase component n=2 Tax=Candidatus Korarchaeum cryptofilum TaxID=498846 RepID=B1L5T0_KORCO|nr:ABC transporter ATP-binding protein [Candidatus Korarchaeum cryptofilum]ACB07809.1 ABC-type oligopeptide transport system, ATPase component [Candidatus Korarchaeum cryptofilum OPF8]RSN69467.1 ABC transporter ATP-binding protein [Candidatus Korarchaeum cryptofilum]